METLDPKDWEAYKKLMHQMVDDAVDFMQTMRDRPIWQEIPQEVLQKYKEKMPRDEGSAEATYTDFKKQILPYPMGNFHPRFWAWYMGNGLMSGAMGDFWASVVNPNLGGANHAAHKIEEQVVDWMKEMMEYSPESSGLLVSGSSMANFVGLSVARNAYAESDVRKEGLTNASKMTVYASVEVHSSNTKALELIGMGTDSMRLIDADPMYRIDMEALKAQVAKDRADGFKPICVIGTAGTINTGAIDPLDELANFCEEEGLWFHVDGAIGAVAMQSDKIKPLLKGIERSDSVALDLHKWMHMPFEAACVLIKDQQLHKNSFAVEPEYLERKTRGLASGDMWFSEYGLQLSRRFNALKIWMSLKEHGSKKFGRMMERNVEQAEYVAYQISQHEELELLAPVGLDIICFRYNPGEMGSEALNKLNQEIKVRFEEAGEAVLGYTTLNSNYCIRFAISNHRSKQEDYDIVLEKILELGAGLKSHY